MTAKNCSEYICNKNVYKLNRNMIINRSESGYSSSISLNAMSSVTKVKDWFTDCENELQNLLSLNS